MRRMVRLDRRLVLEDPMRDPDGAGGFTETWTALGHVWANVVPQSGRETGDISAMRYRITLRRAPFGAPSRPRPDQRFRDGNRIFQIEAVTDLHDDPRHIVCFALEETGA